jgi:hypothetical protein
MKLTRHPTLTPHRLARLTAWMRLKVQAFAAVVIFYLCVDPKALKRSLNCVSFAVAQLVFTHAAVRLGPRKGWKRRAGEMRALIGSRLRHDLRRRALVAHFFAILDVMRDLETHIRRLARRLANGLTRRSPKPPKREHHLLALEPGAAAFIGADSS